MLRFAKKRNTSQTQPKMKRKSAQKEHQISPETVRALAKEALQHSAKANNIVKLIAFCSQEKTISYTAINCLDFIFAK
jgi:ribosomal protein L35